MSKFIAIVLIFSWHFVLAQPRSYLSVSGGVGSFSNHDDGSLRNTYNPRGLGANVGLSFGRGKASGFGWEIGLVHRVVKYQFAGVLFDANRAVLDTNDAHNHYRFILLPLSLVYSHPLTKTLHISIKAGFYAGWKTYGAETLTSRLYPGMGYGFAQGSRFPTFDAFGGQAGLGLDYRLNPRVSFGIEGMLVQDASNLIHPSPPRIPIRFAYYNAKIILASLKYYL